MSDFGKTWVVPVVTGSIAAVVGGVLLAWLNGGFTELKSKLPPASPQEQFTRDGGPDYTDLVESIKIRLEGLDQSVLSEFTGVPSLIFSFTNRSTMTAKISGSNGCSLVGWRYPRAGSLVEINKSAMLNQAGASVIEVPAQATKTILYRVDLLEPVLRQNDKGETSICRFWIGFGGSGKLYEATAEANSPEGSAL